MMFNVTAKTTSVATTFTFTIKTNMALGSGKVPKGTKFVFSYQKVSVTTFKQLANHATWCKSAVVHLSRGDAEMTIHSPDSNYIRAEIRWTGGGTSVSDGNFKLNGTLVKSADTITAGATYDIPK